MLILYFWDINMPSCSMKSTSLELTLFAFLFTTKCPSEESSSSTYIHTCDMFKDPQLNFSSFLFFFFLFFFFNFEMNICLISGACPSYELFMHAFSVKNFMIMLYQESFLHIIGMHTLRWLTSLLNFSHPCVTSDKKQILIKLFHSFLDWSNL